jgi:hypothetical protein
VTPLKLDMVQALADARWRSFNPHGRVTVTEDVIRGEALFTATFALGDLETTSRIRSLDAAGKPLDAEEIEAICELARTNIMAALFATWRPR